MKEADPLEYVRILKALMELPFNVGKNLLADFLMGNYKNKSVIKNNLDELNTFDTLHWNKEKILGELDSLVAQGMVEWMPSDYNRFVKVLRLTIRGQNEIHHPTLEKKKLKHKINYVETIITEKDKERFRELDSFLEYYNNPQKKAIISEAKNLLCVAGAGSGKTTVLTKRIEFLVKYRGIDPRKILAITFTRKARQEMERRLLELGVTGVLVHTFNSFCERILRQHEQEIYGRQMGVQSYRDKILAMNMALATLGIDMDEAIKRYFSPQMRRFKNGNQLASSFMNDCFSVIDYFKVTGQEDYDFSQDAELKDKLNAEMIYKINNYLKNHMHMQGLRDFTDQLIDGVSFLKEHSDKTPRFEHILVDEYQDVNAIQIELLNLLNPSNLFAVGDPRQSIFGWRGSEIRYVLDFEKDHGNSEVIHLTKNYRSSKHIVEFMNQAISDMGLPDLEHHLELDSSVIRMFNFDNEENERNFILRNILNSSYPREEIFVLARTNRQLQELSQILKRKGIAHVVKTDEVKRPSETRTGEITLATVHAIKGLEAKHVFLIGANEQNFPCKASDHPAIEMVKTEHYNKLEEEKRLFYVAVSRAKEKLTITHSGKKPTYFITEEMLRLANN